MNLASMSALPVHCVMFTRDCSMYTQDGKPAQTRLRTAMSGEGGGHRTEETYKGDSGKPQLESICFKKQKQTKGPRPGVCWPTPVITTTPMAEAGQLEPRAAGNKAKCYKKF